MSVKFVSKNANYMIVLRSGVEGNRAIGTHAVPGLYVKFDSGILEVKDESIVELLRAHPSFGGDFVEIKEEAVDPFIDTRNETEPGHVIQEIKYGHAEKATGTPIKTKLTPQMKEIIQKEAIRMIPGLLRENPQILKDILSSLASEVNGAKNVETPSEPVKSETEALKAKQDFDAVEEVKEEIVEEAKESKPKISAKGKAK